MSPVPRRPRDAPRSTGIALTLLTIATLAAALPAAPFLSPYPGPDSGIFLYVASRVLAGEIPYRDVWDHKGPAIYYLDAAALWVAEGSLWGVWGFALVAWLAAVVMGFVVLRRAFGAWPSVVGSFAWLGGLALLLERRYHLSNLTEVYALPFQFAILLLFSGAAAAPRSGWRGTLLGATAAACFLLRPNLIGLPVVAAILLVAPRLRERR